MTHRTSLIIAQTIGALALVSITATPTPAGVVHTEVADTLLTEGGVPVDLDANGSYDFLFFYSNIDSFGQVCNAFPYPGGRAVGTDGNILTFGVGPGQAIPTTNPPVWSIEGSFMIWVDPGGYVDGDWAAPGTEKCVALRITKPDGVHFGWARVRNVNGVSGFYLRDWAYESSPNTPITTPKLGDVILNGVVNIDDLLAVINQWGQCPPTGCAADIDGNNIVNIDDLLVVINHWG